MMYIVKSNGIFATLEIYTTTSAGNTPAQPCMPAVVPKDATVLAVVAFTPRRLVNVSTVNGNTPIEERDVKANKSGAFAFEICNRIVPKASNQDSLNNEHNQRPT